MVKKPNPSRRIHPQKTYSKEFNLLRPGTGIRFVPPEEWGHPKKNMAATLRLALLMLLLGGAAALYLNLPAPPPVRRTPAVPLAPPPRIMQEESVTANAVPVLGGAERAQSTVAAHAANPAASPETGAATAITQAATPPAAARWRIRFGIFLLRENAERHVQSLAKKGVAAAAEAALRPMSAFTLKAGPADNAAAWKDLKSAAAKLNVAPMVEVDGKYAVVGPIWLKDRALVAENAFKAAGVHTEIVEEHRDREVFKVLSAPFETAEEAKRAMGEMQTNGIEGVIDE